MCASSSLNNSPTLASLSRSIDDFIHVKKYLEKLYGSYNFLECLKEYRYYAVWCNRLYGSICILTGIKSSKHLDIVDIIGKKDILDKTLYMGAVLGLIKGTSFIPHPSLLDFLYRCTKKIRGAITAKYQGVKAFLYGNDLLAESVGKIYRPVDKGSIIGIIDPYDNRVIGVGRSLYSYRDLLKIVRSRKKLTPVVKNIFDLGWYLREGG